MLFNFWYKTNEIKELQFKKNYTKANGHTTNNLK